MSERDTFSDAGSIASLASLIPYAVKLVKDIKVHNDIAAGRYDPGNSARVEKIVDDLTGGGFSWLKVKHRLARFEEHGVKRLFFNNFIEEEQRGLLTSVCELYVNHGCVYEKVKEEKKYQELKSLCHSEDEDSDTTYERYMPKVIPFFTHVIFGEVRPVEALLLKEIHEMRTYLSGDDDVSEEKQLQDNISSIYKFLFDDRMLHKWAADEHSREERLQAMYRTLLVLLDERLRPVIRDAAIKTGTPFEQDKFYGGLAEFIETNELQEIQRSLFSAPINVQDQMKREGKSYELDSTLWVGVLELFLLIAFVKSETYTLKSYQEGARYYKICFHSKNYVDLEAILAHAAPKRFDVERMPDYYITMNGDVEQGLRGKNYKGTQQDIVKYVNAFLGKDDIDEPVNQETLDDIEAINEIAKMNEELDVPTCFVVVVESDKDDQKLHKIAERMPGVMFIKNEKGGDAQGILNRFQARVLDLLIEDNDILPSQSH